jgi:hypothetical protein
MFSSPLYYLYPFKIISSKTSSSSNIGHLYTICLEVVQGRERHWVPIPYPNPNPPIAAGMGRVRVHLKLNGWVQMGAHIYYTMALRTVGRLTASAKLRLGLRTLENRPWSTIWCFYDRTMTWNKSYKISHFHYEFPSGYGWVPPIVGHRRVDTGGYGWVRHLRMGSRMWPGVAR